MKSTLLYILLLVVVFGAALATRLAVLNANLEAADGDLPFTLESAIQFRMTERVYTGEGIPSHEPGIQYPDGIDVFRTDTVLAEYVYAGLAHLLPESVPLSTRVRWIMVFWFSLSAPLLAMWVCTWTGSRGSGIWAGLFYAVSLSAVIRSAGLEVSRENFAIPFLVAHLFLYALSVKRSGRISFVLAVGSALMLAMALAAWDMIQFYLLLWAVMLGWRVIRGANSSTEEKVRSLSIVLLMVVTSFLSPYHRAHGLGFSPALLILYGVLIVQAIEHRRSLEIWQRALLILTPLLLLLILSRGYVENYGHFAELFSAKIRFLNQKPVDPSLLTFNQRIMWVPALDSATWGLTRLLFPSIFLVIVVVGINSYLLSVERHDRVRLQSSPLNFQPIFIFIVSVLAFVLFVRFHVFVAIFGWASIAIGWAVLCNRHIWQRVALGLILGTVLIVEANHVWSQPGHWGRPNVYHQEAKEIIDWLSEYAEGEPVLANFGISASLWAYANTPIVLHPKFETPEIRHRVQAYGEALFTKDQEAFRDWADELGVEYYVYALGEFAERSPELQMRYFVDALVPPENAAARTFEYEPENAGAWEWMLGNRKYRIFRIISRADEEAADRLTIQADRALQKGDLERAKELAWNALALLPSQYRAQEIVARVAALKESGFEYRPEPELELD